MDDLRMICTCRAVLTFHGISHGKGSAKGKGMVVLMHGLSSDNSVWRFVKGDLAKDIRVIAVNLPGFGQRDKPDPATLPGDSYGPASLARCVLQAARGRLGKADEEPVTFGGHSPGGTIVLRMFTDPSIRRD